MSSLSSVLTDLISTHESQPFSVESLEKTYENNVDDQEPRSLFAEILDFMLAPLLLVWPLTIVITLIVARSLADAPYDSALRDKTLLLSQQIQFVEDAGKVVTRVPLASTELIVGDAKNLQYQVLDPAGKSVFGDHRLPAPSLYDFPGAGQVSFRTIAFNDQDLRVAYTYLPVRGLNRTGETALVQVAESFEQRNQLANSIIKGVIIPQFFILPLAAALVWFGLTRGLRPLRGLRDRIRHRKADDLSPIDPHSAPHEIVPLVESFNELLDQLNKNLNTQRQFIADAAHQMKTPLAGMRMQAELALRETDSTERDRSLKQLAQSSERASHLINQMLALARTENMGETLSLTTIDLNDPVRRAVEDLAPLAIDANLDLGFDGTAQPAQIRANSILIGELVQNLLMNAIHYTPAGGLINVQVGDQNGRVQLVVEDNGPGIPESEREKVFSRFYRLRDRIPSTEEQAKGSGLGLSIVHEIARLHHASIKITDGNHQGTTFVIEFESQSQLP